MNIADDKLQELKQLDILPIAQHFLPELKRKGSAWMCCSPFSQEKTPSFTVISNAKDNFFKCFSTGKSGDVIEFVKAINNTDFIGACKILAELTGIDLEMKEFTPNHNNQQQMQSKPNVIKQLVRKAKPKVIQSYQKPKINQQELSNEVLEIFKERCISEETVKAFKVSQSISYFGQLQSKELSIDFNYYRAGELVNVKHRATSKKAFGLEKDCELILYNLDNVEEHAEEILITEGEFDALALAEVNGSPKNIISVPNGASTGREQKLSYLDSAVKSGVFKGKKLFLLFDNDDAGKLLTDAFVNRFGACNCIIPTYPGECKDINQVLIEEGIQSVINVVQYGEHPNISGITDAKTFEHKIWDYWKNGYPKGDKVGLRDFDPLLSFRGGELTMVTGISGSGKSEFLDYIMLELAKNHDWRFAVCSMENPGDIHITKIIEKYLKTNLTDLYDPDTGEVFFDKAKESEVRDALEFHYNHFNYIEHATTKRDGETHRSLLNIDYVLKQAKNVVKMHGTKGLVIDPWNTLDHDMKHGELETNYVARILSKIIAFAEDYNVHVFLVAHPTKGVTERGVDRVATLNDISGSGHFFNKTHNGISVFREKDTQKNPDNLVEVHVQKVKFKFVGTLGSCKLGYDLRTGNYSTTDLDYPKQENN
jgi:twinkle protein